MIEKKGLEKFLRFIDKLPRKGKLMLIHDNDADGLCSATIAFRILRKVRPSLTVVPFTQEKGHVAIQEKAIAAVAKEKASFAIILDLAVDQDPSTIKTLEKKVKGILILDHHQRMHSLDSETTTLIKADELSSVVPMSQYCTTKMAYDLYSSLTDISSMNLEWIAAVGIKADCAEVGWPGFLKEISYGKMKKDVEAVEFAIGSIWAVKQREGITEARKVLFSAKKPKDFLTAKMRGYRKTVGMEVRKQVALFKKNAERVGDGFIHEFSSPYSVKSQVINELSWKHYPTKTLIILQIDEKTGTVFISARRQDGKVKTNLLLQKAVQGIPNASAGGHIPASGGSFSVEYKPVFLKNVRSLL